MGDVDGGVPADVAASEGGDAGFAVAGEDPLLAVFILKVADVELRFVAADDRWDAASCCMMVQSTTRSPWNCHKIRLDNLTFVRRRGLLQPDSPFLQIPPENWLISNSLAFAVFDGFPVSRGHVLVLTKRLVPTWFDASPEEQATLMALVAFDESS